MVIAAGLPPELAQGLFAEPGSYDVAIRFAQGPGETLGDRVSTHRGMAIKVFGVEGENGRRVGALEEAHGGTLYLDEVADMPLGTQPKILRVLTDQSFQRVGGTRAVKVEAFMPCSAAELQ